MSTLYVRRLCYPDYWNYLIFYVNQRNYVIRFEFGLHAMTLSLWQTEIYDIFIRFDPDHFGQKSDCSSVYFMLFILSIYDLTTATVLYYVTLILSLAEFSYRILCYPVYLHPTPFCFVNKKILWHPLPITHKKSRCRTDTCLWSCVPWNDSGFLTLPPWSEHCGGPNLWRSLPLTAPLQTKVFVPPRQNTEWTESGWQA